MQTSEIPVETSLCNFFQDAFAACMEAIYLCTLLLLTKVRTHGVVHAPQWYVLHTLDTGYFCVRRHRLEELPCRTFILGSTFHDLEVQRRVRVLFPMRWYEIKARRITGIWVFIILYLNRRRCRSRCLRLSGIRCSSRHLLHSWLHCRTLCSIEVLLSSHGLGFTDNTDGNILGRVRHGYSTNNAPVGVRPCTSPLRLLPRGTCRCRYRRRRRRWCRRRMRRSGLLRCGVALWSSLVVGWGLVVRRALVARHCSVLPLMLP